MQYTIDNPRVSAVLRALGVKGLRACAYWSLATGLSTLWEATEQHTRFLTSNVHVHALFCPRCTCAERGRPQCSAVHEHPVPEHRTRPSGSGAASNTLLRCAHVSVTYVSAFYAPGHTSERVWHLCFARGARPQSVRPQCSAVHTRTPEHPNTRTLRPT